MTHCAAGAFVYVNGRPFRQNVPQTAQQLLKTLPKGAYTSLRVEKLANVLDWDLHVNRLNRSVELLTEKVPNSYPRIHPQGLSQEGLEQRLRKCFKESLSDFRAVSPTEGQDQMVIILVAPPEDTSADENDIYVYVRHAEPLIHYATPIKVWVKGKGRSIPEAKYSQWVTDRMPLEQEKPPDCKEVILVNDQAGLLEGLTSSFYVIKSLGEESVLQTAGVEDGVLAGTFCHVLFNAVESSDLPLGIHQSCPMLSESSTWTEAFVSNSLTGIRPVSELIISAGERDSVVLQAPGEITRQLMQLAAARHRRTALSDL